MGRVGQVGGPTYLTYPAYLTYSIINGSNTHNDSVMATTS